MLKRPPLSVLPRKPEVILLKTAVKSALCYLVEENASSPHPFLYKKASSRETRAGSFFTKSESVNLATLISITHLNMLIVVIMIGALNTTSIRNAPTIGTTRNAVREGPYLFTVADMFAIAFGVAPSP